LTDHPFLLNFPDGGDGLRIKILAEFKPLGLKKPRIRSKKSKNPIPIAEAGESASTPSETVSGGQDPPESFPEKI